MVRLNVKILGDLDFIEDGVDDVTNRLAEQIPIEARRIVDESTPAGILYRRGPITRRASKSLLNMGLIKRGRTRVIAGSKFHRASAPGQPWTKDSGKAYRDIKVIKSARGTYRVSFVGYVSYLEFNMNRPVVLPAIEAATKKVFGDY